MAFSITGLIESYEDCAEDSTVGPSLRTPLKPRAHLESFIAATTTGLAPIRCLGQVNHYRSVLKY
jgi:hypothetical protein